MQGMDSIIMPMKPMRIERGTTHPPTLTTFTPALIPALLELICYATHLTIKSS